MLKKTTLFFILLICSFSFLTAVNYYVDPTGTNDGAHGSVPGAGAWATIGYAVGNVSNPTTATIVIYISADIYDLWNGSSTDPIIINRDFTDLTLAGAGATATVVQGHSTEYSANNRVYFIDEGETVAINDMTIRYGSISAEHGGGIYLSNTSSLTMTGCYLTDNLSARLVGFGGGFGGGMYLEDSSTLSMTNCTVNGNLTNYGGGIYSDNSAIDLTGCTFDDNRAFGGGGIATDTGGSVTLTNCTFKNHTDGGAMEPSHATLTMVNCSVHDNYDDGDGGGIDGYATTMFITNSTIHNNVSDDDGGGIYYESGSTLTITNSTVAHNECDPARNGGGIYQSGGAIYIKNTIIANNIGMAGTRNDFYMSGGSKIDNGYNIVEASNQTFSATGDITGNQSNLNLSAILADNHTTNGTQTLALSTSSVAINAGNSGAANNGIAIPANDQRGTARNGTIDIGAYEYWGNGGANPANPNVEPDNHVLGFDGDYTASIDLIWANNDGFQPPCGYLIIGSEGAITDPVDGTDPADDIDLRGNPGYAIVHVAHGELDYSFWFFDGLSSYDFKIYPYTNSGTIINYKTDGVVPFTTVPTVSVDPEPTNHVTDFHADPYNPTEIDCYWTENDGAQAPDGYLIKASTGAVIDPVDGVDPANDTDLTDGSGNVKVLHGNALYYFLNCSSGTTYNFKIYPYTNSGAYIDFKTDAIVPADDATTTVPPVEPVAGDLIITEICGDGVDGVDDDDGFMEIYNTTLNTLNLNNVEIRYYDNGSAVPTAITWLWGYVLASHEYFIIAQDWGMFQLAYGFSPNWAEMMFPFDGGADAIEIYINDARAGTVDQFNEIDGTAWIWDGDEPLERNSTANGGDQGSWTENTGSPGSPGEGNDTPLPAHLSSFYAFITDDVLIINWATESEENNAGWNIYRGLNDEAFTNEMTIKINAEMIAGAGTTNEITEYSFEDQQNVMEGQTYWYWLESVSTEGEIEQFGPISLHINFDTPITPADYGLKQNYPNPFNPETTIRFALEENSHVQLAIYNMKGQKIRTLIDEDILANLVYEQVWDGNNDNGSKVSSGIYLYKLITDTKTYTKKMIMMK